VRRPLYQWLLLTAGFAPLLVAANTIPADAIAASAVSPNTIPADTIAAAAVPARAVQAGAVTDVSVTVYRAPHGVSESLDLDGLGGFALVTETRTVSIPTGESRIRFEGVADGIQPETALITGLPTGVLEKNHDAQILSPSALVAETLGRSVWLVRTTPKTGEATAVPGTLISDSEGVVFRSAAGDIEALRCSGLPETFHFDPATDATATPTLSALIRSPRPATATVKLSYLGYGFDWMANYVATVSPDGRTIDLGGWVTLANSNAVSFPDAHAQVVAGRLNRESEEVEPVDPGTEILAQCWPRGSTSDTPEEPFIEGATPLGGLQSIVVTAARKAYAAAPAPISYEALEEAVVTREEPLGDLKLYRVPGRTSVTSRQIKQVRLLDRRAIPVQLIYGADISPNVESAATPLRKVLRTRNDSAHHLGLPLPSGQVATFYEREGVPLLVNEAPLRDVASGEEFEVDAGEAADVEVTSTLENRSVDPSARKELPLIPGVVHLHSSKVDEVNRIEITNARSVPTFVELRVLLPDDTHLVQADHPPATRNGHPTFTLTVPAQGTSIIRYRTAHTSFIPVSP
jgi:hypothetical protein